MTSTVREFAAFFTERLRRNWPGYLKANWGFLVVILLAAAWDGFSTFQFMSEGSAEDELHPIIRFVSLHLGPIWGPIIGKAGQLAAILFLTVLFRPRARLIFIPVTLIYLYAAWYNTWGVEIYTPLFLRLLTFPS